MNFPRRLKRIWERDGGLPNIHGKGAVSKQLRDIATLALWEAQEHTCALCGQPMIWPNFARDHVEPFSISRDDSIWNTRLAHAECDRFRSRRPYSPKQREWFEQSGERLRNLLRLLVLTKDERAVSPPTGAEGKAE